MRITISGGLLLDPSSGRESTSDLHLADGVIAAVGAAPAGFVPDRSIDARGLAVCPGLVDLAVRFREPGFEHRASLESELAAAAAGGITAVCCPPDMEPPLDEPGLVEMLARRAQAIGLARVLPLGALTAGLRGERLAELAELASAGCVGFSQGDRSLGDHAVMLRAMQYAATFGLSVWLRPQDGALARLGVAHEGMISTRLGLPGIPALAETLAVSALLLMSKETGARLHLCRLSSADSVAMIRQAKASGVSVTCDVSAAHIHLSEIDIGYFDSNCRLSPPLRTQRDRDALLAGLVDGTIDAVCSDHCPVDEDGKTVPFAEAEPGATGLETLLPLTIMRPQPASLSNLLAAVTVGPARVLGLPVPRMEPGARADVCIFDPDHWWRVDAAALLSKGKNTPFAGTEVRGQVRHCLVAGSVVYER